MSKDDVLVILNEIRRQLWLGHASLMIGSGFSKNAIRVSPTTPCPPDWGQLAMAMVSKLYPSYNENERKEILIRKNVLQLAEEFDATFKRTGLHEFIKNLIQDENLLPSPLHYRFLKLPWSDIFTTNYDTLLERTAKDIKYPQYSVVNHFKVLPQSLAPRIFKLHGSFISEETGLIVTEEDYRKYPEKFKPFVNSVQQAIMENSMCMVGFSGTDPNFLQWIGWVKDYLQESMCSLYLIGLLKITDAERRVFEKRNIIPVDLSVLNDCCSLDHIRALEKFCSFLEDNQSSTSEGLAFFNNWPSQNTTNYSSPNSKTSKSEIISLIKTWKKQREEYPNWLYLSWQKRTTIQTFTELWTYDLNYLKNLPDDWDIRGLYELNWRLEKCLMPIPNNIVEDYECIIQKYASIATLEKYRNDLRKIYLDLCFALLRWSREELNHEMWKCYENKIKELIGEDIYLQNQLFNEQLAYAIAIPNLQLVEEKIKEWGKIEQPLIWKVKYASILSELGEVDKSIELWTASLNEIRTCTQKSKKNLYLLGIEGSILVNLCMADNYTRFFYQLTKKQTKEQQAQSYQNKKEILDGKNKKSDTIEKYRARLHELEQYECNPWENIERFSLALNSPENNNSNRHTYRDFDKTKITFHYHNGWDQEVVNAYHFLRFFEETGISFQIGNVNISNKSLRQALIQIAPYSTGWSFCVLNRIGTNNEASCELLFSQEKIFQMSAPQVHYILNLYIDQLKYIIKEKKNHLNYLNSDFYTKTAINLYEAISRLIVKASVDELEKIYDLGLLLFNLDIKGKFTLFNHLGSVFFKRLFDAMSPEHIFEKLRDILLIKVPYYSPEMISQLPISIDWRGFKSSPLKCSNTLRQIIDSLIIQLDNSDIQYRFYVLLYLNTCMEINIITNKQRKNIANILVKHIQPEGTLPNDNFYKFSYMNFLAPVKDKIKLDFLLKKYYFETAKSFFQINDGKISINLSDTNFITMAKSLIVTCSIFNIKDKLYFPFSEEESIKLFQQLKETWNKQKQSINNLINSKNNLLYSNIYDTIIETVKWLDKILGEVIIPRIGDQQIHGKINDFVMEVEESFDLPCANVALLAMSHNTNSDKYISNLMKALVSPDSQKFDSYTYSLFNIYRLAHNGMLDSPPEIVFSTLINVIGMKNDDCFIIACRIVGSILNYYEPNKTICSILLLYLKELIEQTDFRSPMNRFELINRYDYRQVSAFLAAKLYCIYIRKKELIPSILVEWQQLAQSCDEFPLIRNTWMREVNNAK